MPTLARPSIHQLMRVPVPEQDLEWLRHSLAAAVELELATLPPYLTALWSINDGFGPVEAGITAVVKEEMLHMVLAGNMLRAIGGEVVFTAPSYPGCLPHGVIPHLRVPLAKLTTELVETVFMVIEHPETQDISPEGLIAAEDGTTYPSIGAFYDKISQTINRLQPTLTADRQLSGTVGGHTFEPTDTINKMQTAILEIKEQGEGASGSTLTDPQFGSELSHYERFSEIATMQMPEVYDMADVPLVGYPDLPTGDPANGKNTTGNLVKKFNQQYTEVLEDLRGAWADDDGLGKLGRAVQGMYGLKAPAQALMQIPIAGGTGNYGPTWECV